MTTDSQSAERIRIATYNVKNLFSTGHATQAKRPRELRELARMVTKIDAHVLGLQEVGSEGALAELNERLAVPYPYCELLEGNSLRGIHVAFMSRFPLSLTSHRDVPLFGDGGQNLCEFSTPQAAETRAPTRLRLQRDLLLAQFSVGTHTIAVFNTHLKSRIQNEWSGIDADVVRRAEAQAVAGIVSAYEARNPDHQVLLMGDFNQPGDHPSLQPIIALRYYDPIMSELVPDNTQLSTHWSKPRDRIDYLLLGSKSHQHYVAGSVCVHREAGARKASDHYPVSIVLQL